jgi:hypothetical protein
MIAAAVAVLLNIQTASPASCGDWRECRALALQAADRGEYETFHDLAWRTIQKARPNDPDLMLMLARAQSLSGRPDDAVVMLVRIIAAGGDVRDAIATPDFRRARALPRWHEVEDAIAGSPPPLAVSTSGSARTAAAESPAPRPSTAPAEDGLRFEEDVPFDPTGLAHDAVSRRFVIGDRGGRRLVIVDEMSRHVVPLVSVASAGFRDQITGFEIDPRRGDLWVVSADRDAASQAEQTTLHKLQLVSGRTLFGVTPAASLGPARLADVAVTESGTVLALDTVGRRLLRLRPGARDLEVASPLDVDAVAIAPADDRVVFVAHAGGILRVDLVERRVAPLRSETPLSGIEWVRWYRGSLIAVQRDGAEPSAATRIIRLPLDAAGRSASRVRVVEAAAPPKAARASALDSGVLYYVADGVIRRATVQ